MTSEVISFLRENLAYSPTEGCLRWMTDRAGGKVKAGSIEGCTTSKGYRQIRIHGKWYKAHRLIWLLETGRWPTNQIDHINGDKLDNRFCNLRDVDNFTNSRNRKNNTSGVVGVSFDKVNQKWVSQTYIDGKARNLGRYDTKEEAHEAYTSANRKRLVEGAK